MLIDITGSSLRRDDLPMGTDCARFFTHTADPGGADVRQVRQVRQVRHQTAAT